ncbi:MAG TPA: HTTM domain-containing protein [Gemmataceae bacterium]|jgi:hypothetical protein|nr:HTTM domain-containing protein [Gemmataceae bacterium]
MPCIPDTTVGRTALGRWREYLLRPVDGASLAAFRILFGIILFWEVARYFAHGWIASYYSEPAFHFTYPLLPFLKPWPGNGMEIHFAALGVLALMIALGLCYRLASCLFLLGFTYVFFLDETYYLNHFYLVILFSFLLCVVPAHRVASLDRWLFFRNRPPVVPQWSVFLLRSQVFIVYFFAGLAKLNPDWLRGWPLRLWLPKHSQLPLVGDVLASVWAPLLFSYGALVFDLSIGFLLAWRRTRPAAIMLAACFHAMNSQLFHIGIFPYLAFAATLIFDDPDWPRRVGRAVAHVFSRRTAAGRALPARPTSVTPATAPRLQTLGLVLLHLYLLFQVLVPLRHWLYPGFVSWTDEGHRFSWHMMLRNKRAQLHVYVTFPATGHTEEVVLSEELTKRQEDEMSVRPDMVRQYAHHVADRLSEPGQARPVVRVDERVSLNGRPYQPIIDPTVNLADVPFTLGVVDWILPLETPLPGGGDGDKRPSEPAIPRE